MKGLILKDIINLKKQLKILVLFFAFYFVFSVVTKNSSMLVTIVVLMCSMMPITSLSFDEYAKWDRYALSMPIRRKDIVVSKYLLGIILNSVSIIPVIILNGINLLLTKSTDITEMLITSYVIYAIGLLFIAFTLPILFKFGVEKGRMLMFAVIFIPAMIVMILYKTGVKLPSEQVIINLAYASPFIVAVIVLMSILISIEIYNKKEF